MSKFIALTDKAAAAGWAHAQALRQSRGKGKDLYGDLKPRKDGTIEIPEHAVEKLKLKAAEKLEATKEQAKAKPIKPERPKKPVKPIKEKTPKRS